MAYYSFDIFDTLISRRFATDRGVFAALREQLRKDTGLELPSHFVDCFIELRIRAQGLAHQHSEHPEITLEEVYAAIGRLQSTLTEDQRRALQQLEEALEVENAYGIAANIDRAMKLVESGNEVLLISDMYLSREVVLRMLEKVDSRLTTLPFYLSSDLKKRKADGTLYQHVCDERNIQLAELQHMGDNFHSDCVMASKVGAQWIHYKDSRLNSLEAAYFREPGNLFQQLTVGASKQARLSKHSPPSSYLLGASYAGPLFYGFVHELLLRAENEGIQHVYFLARDGYLLKVIADEIIAALDIKVEAKYLYVSRQSIYFASLVQVSQEDCDWIFQEMDNDISLNRVAKRLHFKVDDLAESLEPELRQTLQAHGFDTRLTGEHVDTLKKAILFDSPLKSAVESRAASYRATVLGYFEQEKLFDRGRIGCVDIGWKGTLQDAIFKVLKSSRPEVELTSYYFAVTHFSPHTYPENRKIPFYMFPTSKPGIGPVFELLLQCNHGTTLSYDQQADGSYAPVLKEAPQSEEIWGLEDYTTGIRDFAHNLSQSLRRHPGLETCYTGVTPILIEKLEAAKPELAAHLGDLLYCGDQEESRLRTFAPAFSALEALRYVTASSATRAWLTQWLKGSYARSGILTKLILSLDPRINARRLVACMISHEQFSAKRDQLRNFVKLQKVRLQR